MQLLAAELFHHLNHILDPLGLGQAGVELASLHFQHCTTLPVHCKFIVAAYEHTRTAPQIYMTRLLGKATNFKTTLHLHTGCSKKTDPLDYFGDNFGKYGLILTIFSLLQQENHGAQNLSYFSHLTFIMLPLYLAKQTLMLVSMSLLRHYCVCV